MKNRIWTMVILVGCQDKNVSVLSNHSPEVAIISPVADSIVLEGESMLLEGTVYDADTNTENLEVYWESNIAGQLTGDLLIERYDVSLLLPEGLDSGEHTLSLVAIDPDSTAERAEVEVTVNTNTAPSVQLISPEEDATLSEMTTHTLVAAVSDEHTPVDELVLLWESSLDGEIDGTEEFFGNTVTLEADPGLSTGEHTLTLKVIDTLGASDSDSVTFTVGGNEPPEVSFLYPDGSTIPAYNDDVFFQVQIDDDQIDLSTVTLEWSGFNELSWVNEELPTNPTSSGVASFTIVMDCFYYDTTTTSTFVLTASATDEEGLSGQGSVLFESYCMSLD